MTLILSLVVISFTIGVCYHYICGIPHIYEYLPGRYCIRSHSKFLDLETYSWTPTHAKIAIWKYSSSKMFYDRCLASNLDRLRNIRNEL